jgi:hypothetical protein
MCAESVPAWQIDPQFRYDAVSMYCDLTSRMAPLRALHDRLYGGEILRFRSLPEMERIVALTRSFVEEMFHPFDPQSVHLHFGDADLATAQRDYNRSEEVQRAWCDLFAAIGYDPEGVARDRLMLRFQPHRKPGEKETGARGTSTVGFHRDTWGTNLYAQVNWWAPVYPITAGRTFALYPDLWSRPLTNDSADFDMAEAMRVVRERKRGQIVPRPLQPADPGRGRPVVIDCGSIIAFSSHHAHAGVPNHSGLTRISLDTRTLLVEDFLAGRGAPNVDGRARWMSPGLFRRLSDGMPLAELLGIDRLVPFQGPWPESIPEGIHTDG